LERVFFLERGFDRMLTNGEELCLSAKEMGLKVVRDTLEDFSFCNIVKILHYSDIIVTTHGSQAANLPFINPGSVVIFAAGRNFIVTEWDLQTYYSRGHYLKLYELRNDTWSQPRTEETILGPDATDSRIQLTKLKGMGWIESHDYKFRAPARHLNTHVSLPNFLSFLSYATTLAGLKKPMPCEVPLPWPVPYPVTMNPEAPPLAMWRLFGWEQNYIPCEPPEASVCKKDELCSVLYSLKRPF